MERHETPKQVARTLARHAPRMLCHVLDPSTGNGALLEPLIKKLIVSSCNVVAVDNDPLPLQSFAHKFSVLGDRMTTVCDDFLSWAKLYSSGDFQAFNCVVMNPPFCARRGQWISYDLLKRLYPSDNFPDSGPIEAGFVIMAIHLLSRRGRLLSILPASLITTPSFQWFRAWMRKMGAIRKVHELPRFAFPSISSRIYLVVFEKSIESGRTLLLNHDLRKPDKLHVELTKSTERLDFGYHQASLTFQRVISHKIFGWRSLSQIALIKRGDQATPIQSKFVVHSTNYRDGVWRKSPDSVSNALLPGFKLAINDILLKRVSRNCSATFGVASNVNGFACSDCVLIIRPHEANSRLRLLFAVRCFYTWDFAKITIERGTGASYISQDELACALLPFDLCFLFPDLYARYINAVATDNFQLMRQIELDVKTKVYETFLSGTVGPVRTIRAKEKRPREA